MLEAICRAQLFAELRRVDQLSHDRKSFEATLNKNTGRIKPLDSLRNVIK